MTDKEAEATTLTDEMRSRIGAVTVETTRLSPEEKPRTFHICYGPIGGIWTCGAGTFIHDVIEKAGGVNIFADLEGWNAVDIEAVIWRDPEVIIVTAMGGTASGTWEWVNTEPRLADVSARKNRRIYFAESNWVERPGPRIVLGVEQIAKYIHPEIFFDPWDYDKDGNGDISKAEAIESIQDYFNGLIAKAQAIEVVTLYFG
jgi:ABC-type Fe3+-hydroxamate transport system, periplasmic component